MEVYFDVNVQGSYNVIDEFRTELQSQGLNASVVLTTSVNGVVGKKGSVAYGTSKAAANHWVRELAIEIAPLVPVELCTVYKTKKARETRRFPELFKSTG